jgi:outer membrane biosynthesis protein TonB
MWKRLSLSELTASALACFLLAFPTAASGEMRLSLQSDAVINGPLGNANNPLKVSSGIMASHLIRHEVPVYPASEGPYKSGALVLRATTTPDGKVDKLTFISGPESLRKLALDTIRQWTYKPFELNGRSVWVQTTITMNIVLGA